MPSPPKPFDPEIAKLDLAMVQLTETQGYQALRKATEALRARALEKLLRAQANNLPIQDVYGLIAEVNAYDDMLKLPARLQQDAIAEKKKLNRQEAVA